VGVVAVVDDVEVGSLVRSISGQGMSSVFFVDAAKLRFGEQAAVVFRRGDAAVRRKVVSLACCFIFVFCFSAWILIYVR
jgi:hypothetical protein